MNDQGQKLVVRCMSVSLDGFGAGVNQRLDAPFGDGTEHLNDWFFATKTGAAMIGREGGEDNEDDTFLATAFDGIGATIIGRNMFTTSRGPWVDDGWTGWWGPNPPYHHDTFVVTHHPRAPLPMEGGTTFHFSTDGLERTLHRAFASAEGRAVRLIGGVTTVREYLRAGLVDEMHLAMAPVLVGAGERVLDHPDIAARYELTGRVATPAVTHLFFRPR
jgi:dihydrofolate reductase